MRFSRRPLTDVAATVYRTAICECNHIMRHRSFDEASTRELARCARRTAAGAAPCRRGSFQELQRHDGLQEGDECLKRLSHLLRDMARRRGDVAARYGGEAFAVILPGISADGGHHFAENLRAAAEELTMPRCRNSYGVVTVSIGLACELPIAGSEAAMLQNADAALYSAEENGRNRVEVFDRPALAMSARLCGA